MDRSVSSTGDPFGFQQSRPVSGLKNPSVSHPRSSPNRRENPPNFTASNGDADNSPSFGASTYPPKPYNTSKRLTVDTTSIVTEDADGPVSIQTTPTSNARAAASTRSSSSTTRSTQRQQQHHHDEEQQQQHQQRSPSMPDMRPLNLSHISPLSQLSESPEEPNYIRGGTGIGAGDAGRNSGGGGGGGGVEGYHNSSVHHHKMDIPTTPSTSTSTALDDLGSFRTRRRSTLSVGAQQQRQQLTQKMLVQLQEQMKRTQTELVQAQQEIETLTVSWQESQQLAVALQHERDSWRQQYEQMHETKMTDQDKTRKILEEKQSELEEWQASVEKEARMVQQKKEQVSKQQEEWMDLQNTVQELESAQQEDQARLMEFDDELHQKHLTLEEAKRRFESNQREQERVLQKQQRDYVTREEYLKEWQQRLEAQVSTLEARQREVTRAEEAIQRSNDQLVADQSEIEFGHQELERRNASYEAKYTLVEQAVEEFTAKRKEEEERIKIAEQKQRDLAAWSEQIEADSEVVTQALHEKLAEAHKDYNNLLEEIEEKTSELEDLKTKVKLFVLEDRSGRQVAAQQAKEAARQLKGILTEVQNAQNDRHAVVESVAELTKEYEQLVVRIQKEEEQWKDEQYNKLERETVQYKSLQDKLVVGLANLSAATIEKHEIIATELNDRVLELETLQENVSAVAQKYQRDFEELELEKSECWELREQLSTRVAHFASSEGREKRMREELEWEITRLKTLIEAERRSYENRIAIGEDDLEEARQRHRSELKGLADSLESLESQRDAATNELQLLRTEVETQQKEFALQRAGLLKEMQALQGQRDSLVKKKLSLQEQHDSLTEEKDSLEERHETLAKEKKSLHKELTRATERAEEALTVLLEYRGEKITEMNERKKMKILMTRLEEHSATLEKKEEELREQQLAFETANDECKENLKDLHIKEQTLSSRMTNMQDRERRLEKATEIFTHQRQKDALASVLNRPLRADREAVSAAFSKWVRVTMFQLSDVSEAKADEANQVLQRQIEDDRMAFHQRETILEESKRTIETQLEESKGIESDLHCQLLRLQDEKEKLTEQVSVLKITAGSSAKGISNRFLPTDDQMSKRVSLLADRESEVKRQELALHLREQNIDGRGKGRQDAAQSEELEDANGRFRKLADQLRQKECDLEWREANLTSELSKCENTQSRLQKLAIQLQQKAEQLSHDRSLTTRRMKECDALESQLQQWQTQLEVPKLG